MLPTRSAECFIFQAFGIPCGLMVVDRANNEIAFRFRRDWDEVHPEHGADLGVIAESLPALAEELGLTVFLNRLEDSFSATFSLSDPQPTLATNLHRTAQALFHKQIPTKVQPFITHLPLYPIQAAAGGFGQDTASDEVSEWIDVPPGARRNLSADEFLVRITGKSMEPEIPDGAICRFRRYVGGSRRGGIYLVARQTGAEVSGEVTIKRYDSAGRIEEDSGAERTGPVTMRPANPEFAEWQLDHESGDRFVTIAEFLEVVED
jgi:SOS-response transcriptional repressor LexA